MPPAELVALVKHLPEDSALSAAMGQVRAQALELILIHGILDVVTAFASGGRTRAPTIEELLDPPQVDERRGKPRTVNDWVQALGALTEGAPRSA